MRAYYIATEEMALRGIGIYRTVFFAKKDESFCLFNFYSENGKLENELTY